MPDDRSQAWTCHTPLSVPAYTIRSGAVGHQVGIARSGARTRRSQSGVGSASFIRATLSTRTACAMRPAAQARMPGVDASRQAHARRHHLRGFGYFRTLGPGIITGASDDDPSGIGTYSQVGAAFRFGFLWTALFTLPLAAAVQETAGRLGLTTCRGLASLIKERFPRWVLIGAV